MTRKLNSAEASTFPWSERALVRVHGNDCSDDHRIGLIDSGDLVGSVFLDLLDHRRGGYRFDIRGDGIVLKNRNGNPSDPFHVGRRSRTQGVAGTTGQDTQAECKKNVCLSSDQSLGGKGGFDRGRLNSASVQLGQVRAERVQRSRFNRSGVTSLGAVRIGFCSGSGLVRFCHGEATRSR